ncbi:class I SAM-dependent methyltransferase [uncultured Sunxiuqinia sp.]|uniref:class I SAM-dependent methyltransferase n=1 Tax=uncultured Sunxiuqinia sp. TaxID=1573825 RepID=UPI0030D78381|tara:strand:+ start:20722 stop:21525 length:804 start_codon:yes stop_codon:yes gene_type:complete
MKPEENYIEINKQSWNNKIASHLQSSFYDLPGFLAGSSSLNPIELQLLGDVRGKSILHLQCHFGQDTLSLGRMGAQVTGVDLSDKAIEQARLLAEKTQVDASFICCDIYDLFNHLDGQFDLVFTSYGTIGWLPDLDRWAKLISSFLKPTGRFVFVEFHPVVWMFDNQFEKIAYNYFKDGAIVETETGTYADREARISQEFVCWNHSLSEVVNSLIRNKLEINLLDEFDYSPYNCFNNSIEVAPKKFRIKQLENKIPMVYSIVATRKP